MCQHFSIETKNISFQGKLIYKDECTLCYESSTSEQGINLCLTCFNGSCYGNTNIHLVDHTQLHFQKTGHQIYLRIKKTITKVQQPQQEINKLALNKEGGIIDLEEISFQYFLYCAQDQEILQEIPDNFLTLIKSIEAYDSALKKTSLVSWELENVCCKHSKNLATINNIVQSWDQCEKCELKSNLWICLTCGSIGCGRKYFDGTGGNNHGIQHYEQTGHPVSVKIGTLSEQDNPSAYCYACNDEIKVYELQKTLDKLGIDLKKMKKTEKTVNELSLELNLNFQLSNKFEKDEQLEKFNKDIQPYGIDNIGNSCYINSVIQMLATINDIDSFNIHKNQLSLEHLKNCEKLPFECFDCQWIGLISVLRDKKYISQNYNIKPFIFRQLVGKDHIEFRTQRQQDALEYLLYLFQFIKNSQSKVQSKIINKFKGESVTIYKCVNCDGFLEQVNTSMIFNLKLTDELRQQLFDQKENEQMKEIQFKSLLEKGLVADDGVFDCQNCQKKCIFNGRQYFKKFPQYLLIKTERFSINKGNVQKLHYTFDIEEKQNLSIIDVQNQKLDLSKKMQEKEDLGNEQINYLSAMGFSISRCKKALKESGNNLDNALNLLLANVDNQNWENDEVDTNQSDDNLFNQVWQFAQDMGLNKDYVKKVCWNFNQQGPEYCINYLLEQPMDIGNLKEIQKNEDQNQQQEEEIIDDVNRNYELMGGVVHLGKSVHVGHYVSFAKRNVEGKDQWCYFNDDKVWKTENKKVGQSFILLFQKSK